MHISLTPELENKIKEKVQSGYYNNASEALRYMDTKGEDSSKRTSIYSN